MKSGEPAKRIVRPELIQKAALDFFWLLNRGYPRRSSLTLVGNRYGLNVQERQFLSRGVFSRDEAERRRIKGFGRDERIDGCLMVDGHNVQITVESALIKRPLLIANDGAMRDIAGQSARYRMNEVTDKAIELILEFLASKRPTKVVFLFDAPMSRSGDLASKYRSLFKTFDLLGEARAVAVPEREFLYDQCIIASSDRVVLDLARRWFDIAQFVVRDCLSAIPVVDFSFLLDISP